MVDDDLEVIELAPTRVQPRQLQAPSRQSSLPAAALSAVAAAALAACGGGGGGGSSTSSTPATVMPGRTVTLSSVSSTPVSSDDAAARFLLQAQFSASTAEIAALRASGSGGYKTWLERQIAMSYGLAWDRLNSQGYADVQSTGNEYADYTIWHQLVTAPDTLRKRAALALSEILVVSSSGIDFEWRNHAMAHYWDTMCKHALGNFRDLLEAITLNVAMGYYLNTKGNLKELTRTSPGGGIETIRQPDENYAREVMQLFTIGLVELNLDGTPKLDGSGNTIDTYTASDVSNLARVFTGYDINKTKGTTSPEFTRLPMVVTANNHSNLSATFLGQTIPANTPASGALKIALDTLASHPNTAPFICKQLIQRLVTSNPTPAYVARVAAAFNTVDADGRRGDLALVFATILTDLEARGPVGITSPGNEEFGKVREPMLRLVQWIRTFGVGSTSGAWKIGDLSNSGNALGQSPLRSPSVFNFFRPGYKPSTSSLSAGTVVPEFQLVNETSIGGYLNYMMNVIDGGLNAGDIKATYVNEVALSVMPTVASPTALVDRLNLLLAAGQLSATTVKTIADSVGSMASATSENRRKRVCAAVLLIMATAEYLIQK